MRALLLALLLAGCVGPLGKDHSVRASNADDHPVTVAVRAIDLRQGAVEFEHTFIVVHPGQTLAVSHDFRNGREYRFEASSTDANGTRAAEGRFAFHAGSWSVTAYVDEKGVRLVSLHAD